MNVSLDITCKEERQMTGQQLHNVSILEFRDKYLESSVTMRNAFKIAQEMSEFWYLWNYIWNHFENALRRFTIWTRSTDDGSKLAPKMFEFWNFMILGIT